MGPKRKKGTANDTRYSNKEESTPHDPPLEDVTSTSHSVATDAPSTTTESAAQSISAQARSTWSWRSKATPTAEVARESISVAQGSTSESSDAKRPPNSVSKSVRGSRKSIPLAAEATKVHATSDPSRLSFSASKPADETKAEEKHDVVVEEAPLPPISSLTVDGDDPSRTSRQSWFGWWSRPDGYASDGEKRKAKKQKLDSDGEVASNTPLPGTPAEEPINPLVDNARQFEGVGSLGEAKPMSLEPIRQEMNQKPTRSWFGLWSTVQNEQAVAEQQKPSEAEPPAINVSSEPSNVENAISANEPSRSDIQPPNEPPKPSGWVFWSSNKTENRSPTPGGTQKQVGELAVADTPSQTNPEAAQFNEQREDKAAEAKEQAKRSGSLLRPHKRGRPEKAKESSTVENSSATTTPAEPSPAPSQIPTPSETPPPSRPESQPPKKVKAAQTRPNLILPSFRETYPSAPNPGYVERLSQYLGQSLRFTSPPSPTTTTPQHISISATPPKIRKAVALGIHGFFPAPLFQKVLGQPTGTSIRFANYAATAIKSWCAEHQPTETNNVEVETVALEGEGYVADRVSTLWKLLLNWLSHLRSADFILVACHSQGVPVAIMLLAKLIRLGALSSTVRIGVCAMAGINMGPFLEYKSRFFGGTALELFEFCDCESVVSKSYAESLRICLEYGIRITFVASIDDQLVSLESALFASLSHPHVSRAVFVDGRLHAPNFLTHLVVFALKLRNLGLGDHGLIRELSAPLAGSLVGGEGHSRIYDEEGVYRLGVEFALESTPVPPPPALPQSGSTSQLVPVITPYEPPPNSTNTNPFFLPFAVRGMLEQDLVRTDPSMREEVDALVRQFEEWRPSSKVLKDVKWRLEGMKSMR